MIKTVQAIALAATVALPTTALAQDSMEMGSSMLTGALINALNREGIDTDCVSNLTLNETAQLRLVLNAGDMSENDKRQRANTILENACERG